MHKCNVMSIGHYLTERHEISSRLRQHFDICLNKYVLYRHMLILMEESLSAPFPYISSPPQPVMEIINVSMWGTLGMLSPIWVQYHKKTQKYSAMLNTKIYCAVLQINTYSQVGRESLWPKRLPGWWVWWHQWSAMAPGRNTLSWPTDDPPQHRVVSSPCTPPRQPRKTVHKNSLGLSKIHH